MAEVSFPFSTNSLATEEQWLRYQRASGTPDAVLDTGFNPSGSSLKVIANGSSSLTVSVGEALVGGFYYSTDAGVSVGIVSNSAGSSARHDLVVLRASQSLNQVSIVYKTGGSTAPSLTKAPAGDWEMRLAEITVAAHATTVGPGGVSDRRIFVAPGATIGNTSYRPPVQTGWLHTENNILYVGTGDGWKQVWPEPKPTWIAVTDAMFGPGFDNYGSPKATCAYTKLANGEVILRGTAQATSVRPDDAEILTMPSGYRPTKDYQFPVALTLGGDGMAERVDIDDAGVIRAPFGPTPKDSYLDLSSIRYFT